MISGLIVFVEGLVISCDGISKSFGFWERISSLDRKRSAGGSSGFVPAADFAVWVFGKMREEIVFC